jgi:ATP-binding protein involved in chromosome partitioning
MMGLEDEQPMVEGHKMIPLERYGVRSMSIGYLIDRDTPVIWRGPMVMKALEQFLTDVDWGELDYLVVDLPPGTGDAQLTLTQQVPLDGAVIVTTPQDVALIDARKGLAMFQRVNVPVLGVIENMSSYVCPSCGHREAIFKNGGGRRTAEQLGVPFLGEIPIDPAIVVGGDAGAPIVASHPESAAARTFQDIADAVARRLGG